MGKSHITGWVSDSPTPAQLSEFFCQIKGGRITKKNFQAFLSDDSASMEKRMVSAAIRGEDITSPTKGLPLTISQKLAREIMGPNFFGVRQAIHSFEIGLTRLRLLALSEIPFSEATLRERKETHILVAVFPLSIVTICAYVGWSLDPHWIYEYPFVVERGEASWQLILKTSVDDAFRQTWSEQQSLIGRGEGVPSARMLLYTIVGHHLATGECLLRRRNVRTSTTNSTGYHIVIGFSDFDNRDISIKSWLDDDRHPDLGISSLVRSEL